MALVRAYRTGRRAGVKRMFRGSAAVLGILLFGGATSVVAEEAHFHIVPHALFKDLSGNGFATGSGATQGTDYDLDNDLDAGGTDLHLGLDLFGRFGRHRVVAGYSLGDHSGDSSLSGNLNFSGAPFTAAGGDVESEIELTRRRLLYGFSFVNLSMLDFGVLVGSDGYEVTTLVSQGGTDRKVELDSIAPALGLNLGIRPPAVPLRIYVEGVFSSGKISDVDTTLTDAYVALDWYIIGLFGLEFGYRYYDLESDDTDQEATFEYRFAGPYAGLVFKF
jgi:hypothetical protein